MNHHAPAPTLQHYTAFRTDDDIQGAVTQFLEDESHVLQGKTIHEGIGEISQWLGGMIQQEREGWAYKIKMSMQEIENHRREALKVQSVIQDCGRQLHLISECCNMDTKTLADIEQEEAKKALPMYIECVTDLINSLVEDRLECLQVLHIKYNDGSSICKMLKSYIQETQVNADNTRIDLTMRMEALEQKNKELTSEVRKLQKQVNNKQQDLDRLTNILQSVTEEKILGKKGGKHNGYSESMFPSIYDRASSPNSIRSYASSRDDKDIKITKEKLKKIKHSAKKLENSLQDALSQIDQFRKGSESTMKYSHASMIAHNMKIRPLLARTASSSDTESMRDGNTTTRRQLPQPPIQTNDNQELEVSAHTNVLQTPGKEGGKENERPPPAMKSKQPSKSKRRYQDSNVSRDSGDGSVQLRGDKTNTNHSCTFRTLVRSLDEIRTRKSYKKGGKVSKCLRCQKLFTLNDNHKKACRYHSRNKERREEYTNKGKLSRVNYVWQCCHQGGENPGCCYGHHL
ncbi:uncharacterized protein LOC143054503 isoform X1 [Mytilus galloprovincialis]|uniref:uncharacterized protein LOC143054503 isoform X1 n=1 Tax=Mytilus galloprovincialis TaxID=29158 RepID=UPI003F7C43E7